MPPLMFTVDELEAVMLGLRWVTRRGDGQLSRAARDTVAKIGAVLPEGLRPFLFDAGLVVPPREERAADAVDVAALRSAIRESRKVAIQYRDEAERPTERTIWPIGIAYYEATRNIIAWCELRTAFRHFRTDRISHFDLFDRHASQERIDAALSDLRRCLLADVATVETGGRPAKRWTARPSPEARKKAEKREESPGGEPYFADSGLSSQLREEREEES